MRKKAKREYPTVRPSLFASVKFFYASMVVFFLEATWIALSGAYSMAFDENTHLGIIRLYSHRFLPFWSQQPAGADSLGAINRDPSYLYHYLISFPYRLFAHFFHSEMAQVIFLRFISIGLFICGLLLFRKILERTGISKALLNVIFALLILTPVTAFLAAQINYDNLQFVFVGATLLLTQRLALELRAKRRLNLKAFLLLAGLCLLGSVVKYAFLPIVLAIGIYLVVAIVGLIRKQKWPKVWKDLRAQLKVFPKVQLVLYVLLIVISGGLFLERYGVNIARYYTPTPECDQVIGVDRCLSYGPWRRNYLTYQDKQMGLLKPLPENPVNYTVTMWGKRITNELFFAVDGTSSNFMTRDPLRITRVLSVFTLVMGLGLFLRWQRELRRRFELGLLLTVTAVYIALLWSQNYADFLHLGFPFAIQGRYLIPVLPILYLLIALGFARLLKNRQQLKPVLAWSAIAILCTQGGGAGIFILSSQPSWDWPNNFIIHVNNGARTFLNYFTIWH